MMIFGRAYDLFRIKWVYLSSIVLFETGSLICGVALNSHILIIGRAIAGIGSAGINAGFMM
jgi:MFS family permease